VVETFSLLGHSGHRGLLRPDNRTRRPPLGNRGTARWNRPPDL